VARIAAVAAALPNRERLAAAIAPLLPLKHGEVCTKGGAPLSISYETDQSSLDCRFNRRAHFAPLLGPAPYSSCKSSGGPDSCCQQLSSSVRRESVRAEQYRFFKHSGSSSDTLNWRVARLTLLLQWPRRLRFCLQSCATGGPPLRSCEKIEETVKNVKCAH
jgi:hypothetical protein